MTPQQIVGIAVRLFSLWLILLAIQTVGIAQALSAQAENRAMMALYAVPALVFLVAIFLWNFPMMVAHKLVPKTHDSDTLKLPARQATAAAAAILGLWIIIAALPQLMATFGVFFIMSAHDFYGMYFTPDRVHQLAVTVVQVGFGFFLLLKPWYVASKVFPASDGGASVQERPPEP